MGYIVTLAYTIYVVFVGINLMAKNELSTLNLERIPSFSDLEKDARVFVRYIRNYFQKDSFTSFATLRNKIDTTYEEENVIDLAYLKEKKVYPLNKLTVYMPVFNIVNLFFLRSKKFFHIINGLSISILITLSWGVFGWSNPYQYFLLFPLSFGLAFYDVDEVYKFPFIGLISRKLNLLLTQTKKMIGTVVTSKNTVTTNEIDQTSEKK
jgi:hypothetical protein